VTIPDQFERDLPKRLESLRVLLDHRPLAELTPTIVASVGRLSYRCAQRVWPIYKRDRLARRIGETPNGQRLRLYRVKGNRLWVRERCRCSGPMRDQCVACDGTGWAEREIGDENEFTQRRAATAKTLADIYQHELAKRIAEKRRKRAEADESRGDEIPRSFPKRTRRKYDRSRFAS
jgi:hypothetical protein